MTFHRKRTPYAFDYGFSTTSVPSEFRSLTYGEHDFDTALCHPIVKPLTNILRCLHSTIRPV